MGEDVALLRGASLTVSGIAARAVRVSVEPRLDGAVAVRATFDAPAERERLAAVSRLGVLSLRDGPEPSTGLLARLLRRTRPRVPAQRDDPTLELDIRVPPGTDVSLDLPGSPSVAVGDAGDVRLSLGSGSVATLGRLESLHARLGGGARVAVAAVETDLDVRVGGGACLDVAEARGGDATLVAADDAAVSVAGGELGDVALDASGSARISLGCVVAGSLAISGRGRFALDVALVLGEVEGAWSGSGRVSVGRGAGDAPLTGTG